MDASDHIYYSALTHRVPCPLEAHFDVCQQPLIPLYNNKHLTPNFILGQQPASTGINGVLHSYKYSEISSICPWPKPNVYQNHVGR